MSNYEVCPVCKGKGLVPPGFYSFNNSNLTRGTSTIPEPPVTCRSCNGRGVLYAYTTPAYVPQPYQPYPVYPIYPQITWTYLNTDCGSIPNSQCYF